MAGDSARRKYELIRGERRQRLRDKGALVAVIGLVVTVVAAIAMNALIDGAWWIGLLFGLSTMVNLLAPSRREVAWRKGAEGELAVGRALDGLGASTQTLHDRRIPRSRANIDHILVAPTGVWTVDAKNYSGRLETRRRGTELWVKGRNRSKLLAQAQRQAEVVRTALADAGLQHVPVRPALCFVGVEWPLLFRPSQADGVALLSLRRLGKLADGEVVLPHHQVSRVHAALDDALPPVVDDNSANPAPRVHGGAPPTPTVSMDPAPHGGSDVTVNPWTRYGKSRLYVNRGDGTTLGYVDLQSNEVVPSDERHRAVVLKAVARYLRQG